MSDMQEFLAKLRNDFIDEAKYLLDQCEECFLNLENAQSRSDELAKIFRVAHTIKGSSATVGIDDLKRFAHDVEDLLSVLRVYPELVTQDIINLLLEANDAMRRKIELLGSSNHSQWEVGDLQARIVNVCAQLEGKSSCNGNIGLESTIVARETTPEGGFFEFVTTAVQTATDLPEPAAPKSQDPPAKSPATANGQATGIKSADRTTSIKVDSERLDSLLDIVGELVVIKSQLLNATDQYASNTRLTGICTLLDKTIRELQDRTLGMRMTQLRSLFLKMKRLAHDLSVSTKKPVNFVMKGEDTEIDRSMVEALADPLLHMIRNSIDHGLENDATARLEANKPELGTVELFARQVGSRVLVCVRDDGRGLNREKILAKALERGLIASSTAAANLSDSEVYSFIFEPGFSTAAKISDLSGRGVGLDVVKTSVERLKGSIAIDSKPGFGTTFTISLPLTTAITEGMLATVSGTHFILPMDAIRELVQLHSKDIVEVGASTKTVKIRDRIFPLVYLSKYVDRQIKKYVSADSVQTLQQRNSNQMVALVECGTLQFGLVLDAIVGQTQVVLKPLDNTLSAAEILSGAAILGDGRVALVLNIDALAKSTDTKSPLITTRQAAA